MIFLIDWFLFLSGILLQTLSWCCIFTSFEKKKNSGGVFKLELFLPEEYPMAAPKVICAKAILLSCMVVGSARLLLVLGCMISTFFVNCFKDSGTVKLNCSV